MNPRNATVARVVHNPSDGDRPEWQVAYHFRGEYVIGESDDEVGMMRDLAERMGQIVEGEDE